MAFSFFKKKKKGASTGSKYFHLTVKEVVKETTDAVTLVFENPTEGNLEYKPGQFITLILTIDGKKYRRAYSLCSSPYLDENPAVTIKKIEKGHMSNFVNNQVKTGDVIEVMEPMGSFVLDIASLADKHVFLFGGGSGITPLLSIAKSALKANTKSKVSLIYANRDLDSVIFRNAFEQMENDYPERFSMTLFLENPPENWDGHAGFVTEASLKKIIEEQTAGTFDHCEFMTCGPEPMMNIVMDSWKALNIPAKKMHRESFVAGNTSPREIIMDGPKNTDGAVVTIILDGEKHQYAVSKNKSILEAGLDENIDMPYSCQSGLCTACRGKCVQGEVHMTEEDGLSDEEKAEGYVLLCVGHPKTDDVIIEIG